MATFQPTKKKTSTDVFQPTSRKSYDSTVVYGWEQSNRKSLDILNDYNNRINKNEWISTDDRAKYRSALDSYIETSNLLRGINKTLGNGYSNEDDQKWMESIASMNKGYDDISGFYSQFASESDYGRWFDAYSQGKNSSKREEEVKRQISSVLGAEDLDQYFNKGNEYSEAPSVWDKMTGNTRYNSVANMRNDPNALKTYEESSKGSNGASWGIPERMLTNQIEYKAAKWMTDDEFKVYNYYYAKDMENGTDTAVKFLESIEESLNMRAADERFADLEGRTAKELLFGISAGLDQFESGLINLFDGNSNYIPASPIQMTSGMVREDLADNGAELPDWMGGASIGQMGYDMVTTTSNMLPSILASTVANMALPGSGTVVGAGLLGASASGNAYAEMLNLGYDKGQARTYSLLVGASEASLQYALGGIGKLGGGSGIFQTVASKIIPKLDNAIARVAIKVGGNMLDEGLEEAVQSVLEPIFKMVATGEDFEGIDLEEVIYSGLLGSLSAGFLEGAPTIAETSIQSNQAKNIYGVDTQALVTESLEIDPENAHAQRMQERLDNGKKVSGYQLNRLVETNEQTLRSQDIAKMKSAVEARLTELGETGDIGKLADVIVKAQSGETLTRSERAVLVESKYGRRVSTEINPRSIESGEYTSKWAENIGAERINTEEYNKGLYDIAKEAAGVPVAEGMPSSTENSSGKEIATESKFDTSEDGKTRIGDTEVTIKEIASIKDGVITLRLEDGATVNATDVTFGSNEDALIYETVAKMDVPLQTANALVKGFNASDGVSAQTYAMDIPLAYQYGKIGYQQGLEKLDLTTKQKNTAYILGRDDVKASGRTWADTSRKTSETDKSKAAGDGIFYDGLELNEDVLTDIQKASIAGIRTLAKMSPNVEFHLYESIVENDRKYVMVHGKKVYAPNGFFRNGNEIYIDINAGEGTKGAMLYTLSHEIVHFIAANSFEDFQALADFLFEHYGNNNVPVESLIKREIDNLKRTYKESGKELPSQDVLYMRAYEEVVANAMSKMLADPTSYEKLAKLKNENLTLWEKIGEAIKHLLDKLKSMLSIYEGRNPDQIAADYVNDFTVEVYEQLQDLYLKGFVNAEAKYQASIGSRNLENFADAKVMQTPVDNATNVNTFASAEGDTLYSIDNKFYTEYDAWDKKDTNVIFTVGTTSDILKSIGMKNQNIILRSGTVLQKIKKHSEISFDTFKGIPELLERPIIVQFSDAVDPATKKPKYDSRITVLGELYSNNGKPVLVSLELLPTNQKKTAILDFSVVVSAYEKNALQQYINENSILYIEPNKKRTNKWLSLNRLQLPLGENQYGSIRIIAYADGKIKVQNKKNMTPTEIALRNAGIIDDFGNLISNSKTEENRSVQDFSSVSNRSLLANALENVAQSDIERNKLKEYKGKIARIEAEQTKLSELRAKIKELSFAKGPRDTEAIKTLQFEANQTANRINNYDRQLLNLEATAALKNIIQREKELARRKEAQKGKDALSAYREKAVKTQRELMTRYQESRKKGIEGRRKTEMRYKIKNVVSELNQYLIKGTKEKHVPIELQGAVAEALAAVNMDTVGAEERLTKLGAELCVAKTLKDMQAITKKMEHIKEMGGNMEAKLSKLKTAYDSIINSDDPLISNSYDDVISNCIDKVIEVVGNTPLRDMSLYQLEAVYDMYRMVLTTIQNTNKAFKAVKGEEISTIANGVIAELVDKKRKSTYSIKGMQALSEFDWNNLKPVYAFERIGSANLAKVFKAVRAGEDVWANDMSAAQAFREEQFKQYKYDSWDFKKRYGFTSTSGMSFELSLNQILSLYAFSKRDQAGDHLKYGGFVFDGLTEVKTKNKMGVTVTYQLKDATAYNLSEETLAEIIGTLTPEQKAFADAMQDYLSTVMGEKGNEVSLALYDIKLFKEKHYFPLKSAPQYMAKAKEQAQGEVKIKNYGFTKETTPKAKNPIVLSSFMDVWAGHVNEMSMYHAFTLPLEDFYRVYNYHTSADANMKISSVGASLENAHGQAAVKYIDQLIKDLNGGARSDPRENFGKVLMSNFKKASVMASLSVVVQQPTAIVRAMALVDPKHFVGKPAKMKHKDAWAEVKKYAPVAVIKEMGYFSTGMGQSSVEWLKGGKTFIDKVDDAISKPPALADEITWVAIWNAVKRETVHTNKDIRPNSEEFLKVVGERFTEVVTKTQVYDSTLARSANMRSEGGFMQMWTSFMAEPNTSINMLQDAFQKGNKKYIARTLGAVYGSVILNSALVSLVYAMRDDDEDETFLEKYLSRFTTEVIDSVNPITYIPFFKDVWSLLQGFDVEKSDMSLINDLIDSLQQMVKIIDKDTAYMDEDELSAHKKAVAEAMLSIVDNISSLVGLPVKNVRRDINGIINAIKTIRQDINGRKTTAGSLGDNILDDVKDSVPVWGWFPDESKGDKLYDAIIKGDTAYIDRFKSSYKSEAAYQSAVRKALRENDPRIREAAEAFLERDVATYNALREEIVSEGVFDRKLVTDALKAEYNYLKRKAEG